MTRRILTKPQAKRDIEDAFVFIAETNEDSGLNFLFAVQETLELIAENPFLGATREFDAPELVGVRMWRIKSHNKNLIFYRVNSDAIEVLRVIHSSRDYKRVFDEEN